MERGKIFNVQRFSTDDGDGIRTSVFLKGCPLRCAWCHNAESLSFTDELAYYRTNCIGCGACAKNCPQGAISTTDGKIDVDREKCKHCFTCVQKCYAEALVKVGRDVTASEVMETVLRDRIFYGKNGGLTITGGEPMAQPKFTLALAKAAKENGVSVVIETSGFGKKEDFAKLLPYTDTFLFDCKASSEDHIRLIGVDDGVILENLDFLCENGANIILRCPVVADANLNEKFVEKIINLAKKYPAVKSVQLMPYHRTGAEKQSIIGKEKQQVFETPDSEVLKKLIERIKRESGKETF